MWFNISTKRKTATLHALQSPRYCTVCRTKPGRSSSKLREIALRGQRGKLWRESCNLGPAFLHLPSVLAPMFLNHEGLRVEHGGDLVGDLVQEPHPVQGRILLPVEVERISANQRVIRLPVLVDVGRGQMGSCKGYALSIDALKQFITRPPRQMNIV